MVKGRERTQKWYLENEKHVMSFLGLTPCKGSGNGAVEKEDGYNDKVLAQLKSTDKMSYKMDHFDLEKLSYHAMYSNKLPLFVLEFLKYDELWLCCKVEDILAIVASLFEESLIQYFKEDPDVILDLDLSEDPEEEIEWKPPKAIKSDGFDKYNQDRKKRYEKE